MASTNMIQAIPFEESYEDVQIVTSVNPILTIPACFQVKGIPKRISHVLNKVMPNREAAKKDLFDLSAEIFK